MFTKIGSKLTQPSRLRLGTCWVELPLTNSYEKMNKIDIFFPNFMFWEDVEGFGIILRYFIRRLELHFFFLKILACKDQRNNWFDSVANKMGPIITTRFILGS